MIKLLDLLENPSPNQIKIYLDMDGVIADFDTRFKNLSGMNPRDFEDKYGKNKFWDFIDEGDNKVRFWAGIPPMPEAKELIDYASKYDYEILTAPSIKKQSLLGKNLWMKKWVGKGLFPSKPKLNFKPAKEKHLIKPNLTPNDILIDDKQSTIDNWNNAGGTGIFFQSTSQAINDLKSLGL
jgi:5'(3')-deoxyribonucleotidase